MFSSKRPKELEEAKRKLQKVNDDLNDLSSYLGDFLAFLPLAVCDTSPAGVIINLNKSFERISGFTGVELIGEPFSKIILEKPEVKESLALCNKQKTVVKRELTLVSKDQGEIVISAYFASRRDEKGDLIGYFVGAIDIRALKESQKGMEIRIRERTEDLEDSRRALLNILEDTEVAKSRIEEERRKIQIIFDNFVDGLLVFNLEGELESINAVAEEFLGVSQDNIIGKSMAELIKEPQTRGLIKLIPKSAKEIIRKELALKDKELVLEVTTKFIISEKKTIANLILLHDITREKVIERLKSQFVSVAAHQLRTPLSIIKWTLSMLIEGDIGEVSEDQKDLLVKADQTNERMIRLINDLLNVARIEEGRFIYRPKTVDLTELVQSVVNPNLGLAQEKGIKLEFKNPRDKFSKIVKVDIEKMSLAIRNLIDNAIFYTHKGKIIISLKRKGDKVEFSVKDTGIGIPKDQQARIFNKFFRGDNAVRMETEGTGLGLFITKNIIEAHGGEVWFESTEKKGTTFFFSLPVIG